MNTTESIEEQRNFRRHGFTLVELIVAMGIFSIMMLALMTFFNSAQKLWTMSAKKNNLYADARVAMDLMAGMLQSSFYQTDRVPFFIDKSVPQFNKIYFVTNTSFKLAAANYSDIYEVTYNVNTAVNQNNTLNIRFIGDASLNWTFFAINGSGDPEYTNLTTPLAGVADTPIINYVVGLVFTPYQKDSTNGIAAAGFYDNLPYALGIKLTMLDRTSYSKWILMGGSTTDPEGSDSASAKEFRRQNEKTFTRMVYLGDRF